MEGEYHVCGDMQKLYICIILSYIVQQYCPHFEKIVEKWIKRIFPDFSR